MKRKALLLLASLMAVTASAQMPDPGPQIEKMKELEFLEGSWEGSGWIQMGPGPRQEFRIREDVRYDLDGLVLVMKGHGTSGEETTHRALGVASFDPESRSYRVRAWEMHGRFTDAEAAFVDDAFRWSFSTPMGSIRYTISTDEEGRWHEIGEWSADGSSWQQFMEMNLVRQ